MPHTHIHTLNSTQLNFSMSFWTALKSLWTEKPLVIPEWHQRYASAEDIQTATIVFWWHDKMHQTHGIVDIIVQYAKS